MTARPGKKLMGSQPELVALLNSEMDALDVPFVRRLTFTMKLTAAEMKWPADKLEQLIRGKVRQWWREEQLPFWAQAFTKYGDQQEQLVRRKLRLLLHEGELQMQETVRADGTITYETFVGKDDADLRAKRIRAFRAAVDDPDVVSVTQHKVGRNAPCPCGSGRKFKKCCLLQTGPRTVN